MFAVTLFAFIQRRALWLALPLGAALSLAFAPFDVWPLAIVCPAFLFVAWEQGNPRHAAKIGFLFTSGTFLAGTYWLYHSVYVIGHAPLPIAIFLMVALAAIMGGYTSLVGYAITRWLPIRGGVRYLVALPAIWVLLEWLRGWLFSGFPWLSLGYAGIDTYLAGLAPVLGVYGLSWMFALMAGAVSFVVTAFSDSAEREVRNGRTIWVAAVVVLAITWLAGFSFWHRDWTTPLDRTLKVAIVQGAVPQEMKWSESQRDATLTLYRTLSQPHFGADIVVWPESALPDWAEALTDFYTNLWSEARAKGTDLVVGQIHFDRDSGAAFNGVLGLSERVEWYNKRHLVPFGEYFPVPKFVREWMRLMSLPHSDFDAGDDDQPALNIANQKVGVTICYEDAYGSTMLPVLREATLLVNVTNDAWFGDSTARHQHLQIARMRALEAGRPLLRAANDGISGIIDSQGRVTAQLPSFKSAVLTGTIQPRTGLTPYARWGNTLVISLCGLAFAMSLLLLGSRKELGRKPAAS